MGPSKSIGNGEGQILLYQTETGDIRIETRLQDETVWLTQPVMAELYQTTQQNISQHIQNIYEEGELQQEATHKKFLSVRLDDVRLHRPSSDGLLHLPCQNQDRSLSVRRSFC